MAIVFAVPAAIGIALFTNEVAPKWLRKPLAYTVDTLAMVPSIVYAPLAFMVWGGGLLSEDGAIGSALGEAIDFAGGLVVHINAGVAALILIMIVGARQGFGKDPSQRPHNLPLVMLGAAILWFGWFGFNAGAAGTAD